jgi:hypothetical protein
MIKFVMPIQSAIIVEIVSKLLKCNIGLGVFLGTFIISSWLYQLVVRTLQKYNENNFNKF